MTDIKHLVRASAEVVRIESFSQNDVYIRLEKSSYSTDYKRYVGIVTNISFNGDASMIVALEWNPEDASTPPTVKVFGEGSDLQMFAAEPAEIEALVGEMRRSIDTSLEYSENTERQRLETKIAGFHKARESLSLLEGTALTAPKTVGYVLEPASN
jgi:hypothetical protein